MLDNIPGIWYNICVGRNKNPDRKEGKPMDRDAKKALQELLKLLSENPDLAERITITIKPSKLTQSKTAEQ
jgi:hypothetical protein